MRYKYGTYGSVESFPTIESFTLSDVTTNILYQLVTILINNIVFFKMLWQ